DGASGCTLPMISEAEPLASAFGNVNAPFDAIGSVSAPFNSSTRPRPSSPETVPPTLNDSVLQTTATLTTSSAPTTPAPFDTVHVCAGLLGCVATATAYDAPLASPSGNRKLPLRTTDVSPAPFNCNTSPEPNSPLTSPPIV